MTYYVIYTRDIQSGFEYADLGVEIPTALHKDFKGNTLKSLGVYGYEDHKKAVHHMLRLRRVCAQYNHELDPHYVPRKDHI